MNPPHESERWRHGEQLVVGRGAGGGIAEEISHREEQLETVVGVGAGVQRLMELHVEAAAKAAGIAARARESGIRAVQHDDARAGVVQARLNRCAEIVEPLIAIADGGRRETAQPARAVGAVPIRGHARGTRSFRSALV